ncbi:terminase small subunit [Cupriavidus pampae]|nr:terminase small subunit [Cupriavidus pampae]
MKSKAGGFTDASGVKVPGAPTDWPFGTEPPAQTTAPAQQAPFVPRSPEELSKLMPLDYLLEVMRDEFEERGRRVQAATIAAPYCHAKKGESGKKEQKDEAAKKVAGRFSPAPPPKLVVNN